MDNQLNYFLPHAQFQALLDALQQAGFACVGPQVRDEAIVYDTLTHATQLPWGIRAHQSPGGYRIERLADQKAFSWANGPQAIKPVLFKPFGVSSGTRRANWNSIPVPPRKNRLPSLVPVPVIWQRWVSRTRYFLPKTALISVINVVANLYLLLVSIAPGHQTIVFVFLPEPVQTSPNPLIC